MATADKLVNKVISVPNQNLSFASSSSFASGSEHPLVTVTAATVPEKEKTPNQFLTCKKTVGVVGFKCRLNSDTWAKLGNVGPNQEILGQMNFMGRMCGSSGEWVTLLGQLIGPSLIMY
ncbi:hypothetical protein R6Q57_008278 [Mikania cordata]